MKNLKTFVYFLSFLLFNTGLKAQQNNFFERQDSIHTLNEVIIKENRIQMPFQAQNRNIQVIGRSQIEAFSGKSLNELLSYAAGIDVRQRGPGGLQADIGIDGGTFDQTLILINGIKISDPQTGHNLLNLPVTLSTIDHIEILHGAAARIYGINTLTGAINIVTLNPGQFDYSVNLNSGTSFKNDETDDKAYISTGMDARVNFAEKRSSHLVSAGYGKGSGYRYNTAFNQYKAFYQGRFDVARSGQLDLTAGYIYNNFGANAFYAAPGDKESEETVKTGIAAVGYKTKVKPNWLLFPRFSARFNKDDYLYIKQTPDQFRNIHNTQVYDAELNNTIETKAGTFGVGFEGRFETIKSTNLGDHQRSNLGLFGEYKVNLTERFLLTAGSYANYNTDYGWQVFPGIDAGYQISGGWKAYVNAGTGQRLPTYTDLYYKSPSILGNDQLRPEIAKYIESGVKFNNTAFSFNTSYFHRRISSFIDWVKSDVNDPWKPENFGQIDMQGYTLGGNYHGKNLQRLFRLTGAGLSYTYLDPQIDNSADGMISRYAAESLRHQLAATADFQFTERFSLNAGVKYCKRINYKDYTLVDSRLSYKHKAFKVYAEVSNLLNVTYIEAGAVPMPGSWYSLGVELFRFK